MTHDAQEAIAKAMADYTDALDVSTYMPKPGDLVFNRDADWTELRTFAFSIDNGLPLLEELENGTHIPAEGAGRLAPMVLDRTTGTAIWRGAVAAVWDHASKRLFHGPLDPRDLASGACGATGYPAPFVDYALRCCVASGAARATRRRALKLNLSAEQRQRMNDDEFGYTIGGELAHSYQRLSRLISHGPSIGTHHENLLRSLLRKYVPDRYHVATGFVIGHRPAPRAQIDIVVYDKAHYVPRFREDDLVVVDIDAVRALVEVKSVLSKKELKSALEILHTTTRLEPQIMPYFKGIYAFDGMKGAPTIGRHIIQFYREMRESRRGHLHYWGPVDAVTVRRRACVFLDPLPRESDTWVQSVPVEKGDEERDVPTSHFLWTLFGFLDVPAKSKQAALKSMLGGTHSARHVGRLNESQWKHTVHAPGVPTDPKQLEAFAFHVNRWRLGWEDWRFPR